MVSLHDRFRLLDRREIVVWLVVLVGRSRWVGSMWLAAEGGGSFYPSASGFISMGLTLLLLLGRNQEEKSMSILPWNQLVSQETEPNFQPNTVKNQLSCACPSFVCFTCNSSGLDSPPSSLKAEPVSLPHSTLPSDPAVVAKDAEGKGGDHEEIRVFTAARRCLKKLPTNASFQDENDSHGDAWVGNGHGSHGGHLESRKVQWTDASGKELVEIREFVPSEAGRSDEEIESGNEKSCLCVIM